LTNEISRTRLADYKKLRYQDIPTESPSNNGCLPLNSNFQTFGYSEQ